MSIGISLRAFHLQRESVNIRCFVRGGGVSQLEDCIYNGGSIVLCRRRNIKDYCFRIRTRSNCAEINALKIGFAQIFLGLIDFRTLTSSQRQIINVAVFLGSRKSERILERDVAAVHQLQIGNLTTTRRKGAAAEQSGVAGIQELPVVGNILPTGKRGAVRHRGRKFGGGDRIHAGLQGVAEPSHRRPDQHDCTQKHAENADAQRAVQAGFLWLAVPRAEPVRTIHFHNGTSFLMI